jgi:hypothetical protein
MPAQSLGRVRDAFALLCLGIPLRSDLVELSLVKRSDMRAIELSQIVRSTILDLAPEPSAHDLYTVPLHDRHAALVAACPPERVASNGIDHHTTEQEAMRLDINSSAWQSHQSESGPQEISVAYVCYLPVITAIDDGA